MNFIFVESFMIKFDELSMKTVSDFFHFNDKSIPTHSDDGDDDDSYQMAIISLLRGVSMSTRQIGQCLFVTSQRSTQSI